jgi:hypothetical protein
MLAAFVYFSPKDENPEMVSGNWSIEDITVDNVDQFYVYNFNNGLWQTGRLLTDIRFKNINAAGILGAFNITGDKERKFNMIVINSTFSFREQGKTPDTFEGAKLLSPALFNASKFNRVVLQDVTLKKENSEPVLKVGPGNALVLNRVKLLSGSTLNSYNIEQVKQVTKKNLTVTPSRK